MTASRHFFTRLVFAGVGMGIFCVAVYAGLGWLVLTQPDWFKLRIGSERLVRLWEAYAHTAAKLLPQDSDGDGICDGFEIFDRTDPKQPLSHRPLIFSAYVHTFSGFDFEASTGKSVRFDLVLQPGVRRTLTADVTYGGGEMPIDPEHFPPSLRLRIVPPQGVAVAPLGGDLVKNNLEVSVAQDGSVAFDVEVAADDPGDWTVTREMTILNAATGEELRVDAAAYSGVRVTVVKALPAMPVTIELPPGEKDFSYVSIRREIDDQCMMPLRWEAPPANADHVLLEGARDEPDAMWCPIRIYPREVNKCGLLISPATFPGMLKFRAVPIVSPVGRD
jgi:hypothetical protein